METFALLGFIFGIIGFTTAMSANKKIKQLEQRIQGLENKE